MKGRKLLYFVTEDWYFCSHRLPLAIAAQQAGFDVSVVTRVREHRETIQRSGVRLIPFEFSRRSMNPLAEIATIIRLICVYRRERPDIVHHVAVKPVLYGSIAARFVGACRVVNALAGLGWLFTSDSRLALFLKFYVRQALGLLLSRDVAIVQNPDDKDMLQRVGVRAERIRVIRGSGVDTGLFKTSAEPEGGVPVVVLPARMLRDKGVEEFVAAARQLRDQGSDARFVLVGDPDPENPASIPVPRLQQWQQEGVVEWWGWRQDMPAVFANAHLVCLPSYREGLPKALIEAAAAGRAIVTTDVPGCREVVVPGETGILVPPRDVKALASALQYLLANRELRQRMGWNARKLAEEQFDTRNVVQQTLALYESL
jgi:glycosyltransferase involved in cell wall biosynthesis